MVYNHPKPPQKEVLVLPEVIPDPILCNCWLNIKRIYPTLPNSATVVREAKMEQGPIAVFKYHGVQHFAIVTGIGMGEFHISETNYRKCKKGQRTISYTDPNLIGFYTPSTD